MFPVWKGVFRRQKASKLESDMPCRPEEIPVHVAVIMDGNGRWARRRALPRAAGHHAGMLAMREVIRAADDWGIKVLTLYSFSTENWKRPRQEIDYLWQLVDEFFKLDIQELVERNVHIRILGDPSQLPLATQQTIARALEQTKANSGLTVQFALNYGSRWEIVKAVQQIATRIEELEISVSDIDEQMVSDALATAGLPDPDLLIRTAGDQRISNFLLWQIAYAEFVFVDVMWPEFTRQHFYSAIQAFVARERRFGGLK